MSEDEEATERAYKKPRSGERLLPVTLLTGFLGAGKTTLLKHILQNNSNLKIAVVVNDMGELNIDKSLIDMTDVLQSDDVIAMQNGCVCCTLRSDLMNQIIELAKKDFDYMVIEASGVAEPREIARLFNDNCEEDHDHNQNHQHDLSLGDVALLDTIVTVVDSGHFHQHLDVIIPDAESVPKLIVEQIENSNVLVLNKLDLVNESQLGVIRDQITLLNHSAKILEATNSQIDVREILSTSLFKQADFDLPPQDLWVEEPEKSCCKAKRDKGESPCCRRARTVETSKSQVLLGKTPGTRHATRFGISSLIYKARRPFHPLRFHNEFVNKFFCFVEGKSGKDEEKVEDTVNDTGKNANKVETENQSSADKDAQNDRRIAELQKQVTEKQQSRTEALGMVLRSKGFLWIANTHDLMATYSQAGSIVTIETNAPWTVLDEHAWTGKEEDKTRLREKWVDPWGDRRQEVVVIGQHLKHKFLQEVLDSCLLTDEEFGLGVDYWKATMGDIFLDGGDDDEQEGDGDEEDMTL